MITGIGWLTAGGIGYGRGQTGFSLAQGPLPVITRQMAFPDPMPRFGRMDDLSRLGLSAMAMTLKDAGYFEWSKKRNFGILAGTTFGCLHTDRGFFDTTCAESEQSPSPSLFAYTLPNCMLGEAAIIFGLTGPSYVVNNATLTDTMALRTSLENILAEDVDRELCGVCDLGKLSFMKETRKTIPGAIFFLLEKSPDHGKAAYGHLDLNGAGEVLFNNTQISDMIELTRQCLANVKRTDPMDGDV
jgi:3-oxoacyl-[acyl-carrier-protein] synthase II